jgi:hypothetical protein
MVAIAQGLQLPRQIGRVAALGQGKLMERAEVYRGDVTEISAQLADGATEHIRPQEVRVEEEPRRIKDDLLAASLEEKAPIRARALPREIGIGLSNGAGGAEQRVARGRIEPRLDAREHLVADVVPRGGSRPIRRILAVRDPVPGGVVEHKVARNAEEGPRHADSVDAGERRHAPESVEARAPDEAKQDRLRLVVRGVGREDPVGSGARGDLT